MILRNEWKPMKNKQRACDYAGKPLRNRKIKLRNNRMTLRSAKKFLRNTRINILKTENCDFWACCFQFNHRRIVKNGRNFCWRKNLDWLSAHWKGIWSKRLFFNERTWIYLVRPNFSVIRNFLSQERIDYKLKGSNRQQHSLKVIPAFY